MHVAHVSHTAPQLEAILARVRALAVHNGRQDLADRLDGTARLLANTDVRVVVAGQFKQGKSALVNSLVSAPVCPVDDVLATSVPTIVRWGSHPSAALVTEVSEDQPAIRTEIDPRHLREHVTDLATECGTTGLRAEIALPRRILADGLVFIDTPGAGRAQSRVSTNLTLLPQADAVLMVSDATQELTAPELNFLQQAVALCPRLTCVISKIDLQHQWRGITEVNTEHLSTAGIDAPVLATSALLEDLGIQNEDAELRAESGIRGLAEHLHRNVHADVIAERHRSIADEIDAVGELLAMVLQAEIDALADQSGGSEIVHDLRQAEENAERLTRRSARWQQTLSDGVAELLSDTEFDLRDRLRAVNREADQLIESCDPGKAWEDIGAWLAESVTQAVSDNFVWAHQRSLHLADVVAQHFTLDGRAAMPELSLSGTEQALAAIGGLDFVRSGNLSIGQKLMIGMKGSYGGVLMFGLMTTLAGMALVNPISVAAGLIMGGFAYRHDATQRLEQRRNEARMAVRKLIDEAIFQVGKESRDRMHKIRRVLRDHFVSVAENFKSSLGESVRKARQGAALPPSDRERRAEAAKAELQEIRSMCLEAAKLVGATPEPEPTRVEEWSRS
ncbi:dynamin family protein [Leucobacter sp. GX24907]